MKNSIKTKFSAVLMIVLGAALAIAPAHAQTSGKVLVSIPFDFSVGNNSLKAGSYQLEALESGVLVFSATNGQQRQIVFALRGDSTNLNQRPHLEFTRYGTEAFLSRVFLSGSADSNELLRTSREKKLIRDQVSREEVSLLIQPAR